MKRLILGALLLIFAALPASAHPRLHHPHHHACHHVHRHHRRHATRWHRYMLARHTSRPFFRFSAAEAQSAPRLLAVAERFLGAHNFTGHRGIPWCAAAVGSWLRRAGYQALASLRAIDYLRYGRPTYEHVGAIAVFRHHIGIVAGAVPRWIYLLSGNHGHRVAYGWYPTYRVISYREPIG